MRRWLLALLMLPACSSSASSAPADAGRADGGDVRTDAGSSPRDAAGAGSSNDSGASADAGAEASVPPPAPAAFVTTDDLSQALSPVTVALGAKTTADATITVDPTTTYQSIVGFGASITDSSSYVMTKYLSAADLATLLAKLFDPAQGIGLGFLRQPLGASDFSSVGNFSYDDGAADPALSRFSIAQDLKATIPVLKQALAVAPGLVVLGTPWSPPAWMKNNDSMDGTGGGGGSSGLAGDAYDPLAQYFVKWVQAYVAQGIPVRAVTPQNEPLNGAAAYPGMDLDAPSELALIATHMGPAFQSAGLTTQIWAYDHNWDVESYPAQIMSDATAGGFTEGAAFHCYGGDPSAMTTFHQAFPQKSVYMTECSGGTWQSDPFASTIDLAIDSTANWARAVALWNMALDENAGPQNDGCSTCRGVVTVNSGSGEVTYNADYYALGHFAKFVRPGAVRIASASSSGSLNQVAFANTAGSLVFIAHNTGSSSMTVRVGTGAASMDVTVPSNAAVTLIWTP
ncbi:MAG TPA: glycoside hydrolase family 30 beta sandwich domain-containing protein [Polyangiaceae bacterium]|jgi:glucosylceramidase